VTELHWPLGNCADHRFYWFPIFYHHGCYSSATKSSTCPHHAIPSKRERLTLKGTRSDLCIQAQGQRERHNIHIY
jgi:hypothetical protein